MSDSLESRIKSFVIFDLTKKESNVRLLHNLVDKMSALPGFYTLRTSFINEPSGPITSITIGIEPIACVEHERHGS
jgi:hypothetical protein